MMSTTNSDTKSDAGSTQNKLQRPSVGNQAEDGLSATEETQNKRSHVTNINENQTRPDLVNKMVREWKTALLTQKGHMTEVTGQDFLSWSPSRQVKHWLVSRHL